MKVTITMTAEVTDLKKFCPDNLNTLAQQERQEIYDVIREMKTHAVMSKVKLFTNKHDIIEKHGKKHYDSIMAVYDNDHKLAERLLESLDIKFSE